AMASPYGPQWHAVLQEEFSSLWKLGVYKLVSQSSVPASHTIMQSKPVFKLKCDQNGAPV
ncbi:hypothetical protein BS17DRAFT_716724, partial [Gyrodon lividus]